MNEKIRWKITDPLGNEVCLKESTYIEHILKDHSPQDSAYRMQIEREARITILTPSLIVSDGERNLYYKVIGLTGENLKIRMLKVVVEKNRNPQEVVTWTILRKGDNVKGDVIYGHVPCKEI